VWSRLSLPQQGQKHDRSQKQRWLHVATHPVVLDISTNRQTRLCNVLLLVRLHAVHAELLHPGGQHMPGGCASRLSHWVTVSPSGLHSARYETCMPGGLYIPMQELVLMGHHRHQSTRLQRVLCAESSQALANIIRSAGWVTPVESLPGARLYILMQDPYARSLCKILNLPGCTSLCKSWCCRITCLCTGSSRATRWSSVPHILCPFLTGSSRCHLVLAIIWIGTGGAVLRPLLNPTGTGRCRLVIRAHRDRQWC
jgi:hypothetical protein